MGRDDSVGHVVPVRRRARRDALPGAVDGWPASRLPGRSSLGAGHVRDVMTAHPVTIQATSGIRQAVLLLAQHAITALPVVDDRHRLIGMISEADVLAHDGVGGRVGDVMRSTLAIAHPETELAEVARVLTATGVKSLPVIDASDQIVGLVSRSDVVRVLARDDEMLEQDVVDELVREGLVGCRVQVRNGVVQLYRTDAAPLDLRRAVEAVIGMPGVIAVHAD